MTTNDELAYASVGELRRLIAAKEIGIEEIVRACLDRIDRLDPALNAVVARRDELALADARAADRLPVEERGPLHGIPVAIKDVTETKDMPTTYGSVAFRGNQGGYDAAVVSLLRSAGGILVCKTNTPELACEPVTRGELHGETHNPWALEHTPGGSSGGAGAGLAAGLFTLAQGTDAGGSIRIPASCCGLVGFKPTRGLVSMDPAGPATWGGLLHNGPLARTVRDAAAMLDVMAAPWPADRHRNGEWGSEFETACDRPTAKPRIAYSTAVPDGEVDADVAASFAESLEVFRSLGAELVEAVPDFRPFAEPFMIIASVAFAGMGAEMTDDQIAQIGPKCLALMKRGWKYSGAAYYDAQLTAYHEASKVLAFWRDHDLLLTPTAPMVPPRLDEFPSTEEHDAKWAEYGYWETFTSPANITGQPAISLPCRPAKATRLPIGIQLMGRLGAEAEMLALAAAYEKAVGWADVHPPEAAPRGGLTPVRT